MQNIEAMKIDAVVIRHPAPGSPKILTEFIDACVINAGDGTHEHPTQAILDMMSLQEKLRLSDLKIGIVGDIMHSRVTLSNIYGLKTIETKITICESPNLIPRFITDFGVKITYNVDELIEWADAINVLRIQRERMGHNLIHLIREYRHMFGFTVMRKTKKSIKKK